MGWQAWEGSLRRGAPSRLWADLRHRLAVAQRMARQSQGVAALPEFLSWSQRYLAHYFRLPPSGMHRWLAAAVAAAGRAAGKSAECAGSAGQCKIDPCHSGISAVALLLTVWNRISGSSAKPVARPSSHLENLKHELVCNEDLLRDYPQLARRGPVWRAHYLILGNGVAIEAIGSLQALRGRRRLAHRPTLIICDDIQSDRHVLSPLGRQRTRDWFFGTLLPAGTPRTCVIHLATALHPESLGLELTRTAGWRWRVFRAIERWPLHMELWKQWEQIYTNTADREAPRRAREFFEKHRAQMEAGAKVLWPEAEDLYTLMAQRAEGGPAAFEREKQNHPVVGELCEWPPEYFQGEIYFHRWPAGLRLKVMALDPSQGNESRLGDYSAYVILGASRGTVLRGGRSGPSPAAGDAGRWGPALAGAPARCVGHRSQSFPISVGGGLRPRALRRAA